MNRTIVIAMATALLLACAEKPSAGPDGAPAAAPEPAVEPASPGTGEVVPAGADQMTMERLDGSQYKLADSRGKYALVNFWATWCGPCRYEIPELVKLQNEHRDKGFEIIGVTVDDASARKTVEEFAKNQSINYPVVLDPRGELADRFQISVLPTTFLLDPEGKMVWKHIGMVQANDPGLQAALAKM